MTTRFLIFLFLALTYSCGAATPLVTVNKLSSFGVTNSITNGDLICVSPLPGTAQEHLRGIYASNFVTSLHLGGGSGDQWTNASGLIYTTNWPLNTVISNDVIQFGNRPWLGGSDGLFSVQRFSTNVGYLNTFTDWIDGNPGLSVGVLSENLAASGSYTCPWSLSVAGWNRLPSNGGSNTMYFTGGAAGVMGLYNYLNILAVTEGEGAGVVGYANSDTHVIYGVSGVAKPKLANQIAVGVVGESVATSTGVGVGGYFGSAAASGVRPIFESAVLLLDSRTTTNDLIIGRTNNGTQVFRLKRTGEVDAQSVYAVSGLLDNLVVTNGINHIRRQMDSTVTTNQIDVTTGSQYYYWTNMVTNVVLQITNVFSIGVTNRTLDFMFTGATNAGPNYTVQFICPAPGGVNFRWGINSVTNGGPDVTVTNNMRLGVSLTFWESNVVECYYSAVR